MPSSSSSLRRVLISMPSSSSSLWRALSLFVPPAIPDRRALLLLPGLGISCVVPDMDNEDMKVDLGIRLDSQVNDDDGEDYNEKGLNNDDIEKVDAPCVGMEFPTDDDAYNFYNAYALKIGFGIRKYTSLKSRRTNFVLSRIYVCNKQGQVSWSEKQGCSRNSTRNGCNSRMKIIRTTSETWRVNQFEINHNSHELISPNKVIKHRSHKHLHRTKAVRNLIEGLHDQGLGPSIISKVVNEISGSQHGTITPKQCGEQLRVVRKNNIGRECIEVIKHFQDKRLDDPNFYFAIEVDQDRTLRSVFWADGRSRASYSHFGDVIVFDVTYRTNKFNLPFTPFTGVNHHRQSTLFGCALLVDETEEAFVWLFQEWLKCMCGQAPGAILTDQDPTICNAIARVFPHTRHRYCKWHLDKHIAEHMIHLKSQYGADIENEFQKLQHSDSLIESERCWDGLMVKYNFEKNSYLARLWDKHCHWIPCYLKDIFLASMKTTQRSESINAFFDGFVHSQTPLTEFVKQYDNAVASRRAAEEDADFRTLNSEPVLFLKNKMEVQAGKVYTRKLFDIFPKELKEGMPYWYEKVMKEGNVSKYIVGPDDQNQSYWKTVTYDDSDNINISCDCAKFEMEGVLCKHALKILNKKKVAEIPDHYILKRWIIELRYRMSAFTSLLICSSIVATQANELRKWSIRSKLNNVMDEVESYTIINEIDSYLLEKLIEIRNQKKINKLVESSSQVGSSVPISHIVKDIPEIVVRDPSGPAKTKGRPKVASRLRSGLEQSQEESQKKQRTCGFCGEKGHYKTGCYKAKVGGASTG